MLSGFPGALSDTTADPFNKELLTGPFAADVGEGFDVEVFLAVDDVRGWGVDGGGGEGAKVPLEVGDVDDGVAADVGGKVDFVDDVGTGFEHWVRAVELRAEFPTSSGGGGGVKEGGFNPDEVPAVKVTWWRLVARACAAWACSSRLRTRRWMVVM